MAFGSSGPRKVLGLSHGELKTCRVLVEMSCTLAARRFALVAVWVAGLFAPLMHATSPFLGYPWFFYLVFSSEIYTSHTFYSSTIVLMTYSLNRFRYQCCQALFEMCSVSRLPKEGLVEAIMETHALGY
jgi:hypothetical protein